MNTRSTTPSDPVDKPRMPSCRPAAGRQPICSDEQRRRIDPIWLFGRVPTGFWENEDNRRNYMFWLAGRLQLQVMEDWYLLRKSDVCRNRGSRLLVLNDNSPSELVMRVFPGLEWLPWLFHTTRKHFFDDPQHRRRFVLWLGKRLRVRDPEGWYQVTQEDVRQNGGRVLLESYSSVVDLLAEVLPDLDWEAQRYQPFTIEQILAWADEHFRRFGRWPGAYSGPVLETGETWQSIDRCLRGGYRGLPGDSSLARLLAERRGTRNVHDLPKLSVERILAWADVYAQAHGRWPDAHSGEIPGCQETWQSVDFALKHGRRGLPGGLSLTLLLRRHRGRPHASLRPRHTQRQILRWMKRHWAAFGRWPTDTSGPVVGCPGENWKAIDIALRTGLRGLPGGSSLARLRRQYGLT